MLGAEYDYGVSFNPDVGVFFSVSFPVHLDTTILKICTWTDHANPRDR